MFMRKLSLFIVCMTAGWLTVLSQTKSITGFTEKTLAAQLSLEQQFDGLLQTTQVDQYIKDMSARPHHVGSPGGKQVADYIYTKFKSWGFDVQIETYYVLFPTPTMRLLEMTAPVSYKALLEEPALKEDGTSNQKAEQLPVYNCWSADGDVTAELVFVNYGIPEDYERLKLMGIDVKGKIVIAKYGRSWRGIKPKLAQENGAIGCIIYSDPKEDGYYQGDVYPTGAFKNKYGAQRGSVEDMPVYPGDPLTPGYASTKDAKRLDRSVATNLLKIPVLPISYSDAEPLLRALEGPVAPEEWRGALPITYHIGPGKANVHLKVSFNWQIRPAYNVIAKITGSEWPDEWVIRGNHHDAWVNGANDPLSGLAAEMEEARAIGELVKTGWRPKRTLLYCAWDAEEPGLLGSTEWVEHHAATLQEKAVAYINSDGNSRGFLDADGSHALEPFMNEIARDVTDPQAGISILDRFRARQVVMAGNNLKLKKELLAKKTMSIGALGSGSDYSPFIQHLGIPSLSLGFSGEGPGGEYHSIYDSYDHYRKFKDPGFAYGVVLAKTSGRAALRLANADVLPFDYNCLYKTIQSYVNELTVLLDQLRESTAMENQLIKEKKYEHARDPQLNLYTPAQKEEVPYLNFASLQNALAQLEKTATTPAAASVITAMSASQRITLNKKLYQAEQQLLTQQGLPRRGWYRHTIYAPGFYTGYGVKTMPGIREAIEQRNWKEAQEQIEIAAHTLTTFTRYLENAYKSLD
jgi:N-acetylated-alpha-linked acidic dipeptidase